MKTVDLVVIGVCVIIALCVLCAWSIREYRAAQKEVEKAKAETARIEQTQKASTGALDALEKNRAQNYARQAEKRNELENISKSGGNLSDAEFFGLLGGMLCQDAANCNSSGHPVCGSADAGGQCEGSGASGGW